MRGRGRRGVGTVNYDIVVDDQVVDLLDVVRGRTPVRYVRLRSYIRTTRIRTRTSRFRIRTRISRRSGRSRNGTRGEGFGRGSGFHVRARRAN